MDFLDPNKKKKRKIRVLVGNTLMATIVAVGTFILVLQAYGFDLDRKNGQVIQNGLLFIDSAPDKATITLNGEVKSNKTNARLSLPEGVYNLEISKEGYRTWKRTFELEGGKVERFTYPALYLQELSPSEIESSETYGLSTQTPDRSKIILMQKNNIKNVRIYDLGKRQNNIPTTKDIVLSDNLMNPAGENHKIKTVEWSTDNKNLLINHIWDGGNEFVVVNIDKPNESFNINQSFGKNPTKVSMFDKKVEKFYFYLGSVNLLELAERKTSAVSIVQKNVISYKTHGDNIVFMSVISKNDKKVADVILREDDKDTTLLQVPVNKKIPLDFARSGKDWYAVIAVESEERTYVYKNPIEYLDGEKDIQKAALLTFKSPSPITQVSFSQNTRFIMSQSGQVLNVYDTETDRRYDYKVKFPIDKGATLDWMDGHRLITHTNKNILIFDFDGINYQQMINSNSSFPVMYDRDYTELYTIGSSSSDAKKSGFFSTQLRFEQDK